MLLELSVALCAPPQNHVALFERLLHLGFKPVLAKGSEQMMNLEVVEIFVFWSRIDTVSHRTKFVPESVRLNLRPRHKPRRVEEPPNIVLSFVGLEKVPDRGRPGFG
jgi:hypothetical protein